jgi:PAS domain S-box-containing protein
MIAYPQAEADTVLAKIVRSSDDVILGKTLDAFITSWNPAAERMYGYTAEETIGRPVSMLLPPERYQDLEMIMGVVRYRQATRRLDSFQDQLGRSTHRDMLRCVSSEAGRKRDRRRGGMTSRIPIS